MTKSLLQNSSDFLLQNATVITKCDDTICDVYYKMRRCTLSSVQF